MTPRELILNTRFWAIAAGTIFGSMILVIVVSYALASRLEVNSASYRAAGIFTISALILLVVGLMYCLVPIMVRVVLSFQVKIGNSQVPIIAFFLRHEHNIVLSFWVVYLLGFLIASPHLVRALLLGKE